MTVIPGDEQGKIREDKKDAGLLSPAQVAKLHVKADTDSASWAKHHTLGAGKTQASQGNHQHDGVTSKKLADGRNIIITGSKGGNAALGSLISQLANLLGFTDSTT